MLRYTAFPRSYGFLKVTLHDGFFFLISPALIRVLYDFLSTVTLGAKSVYQWLPLELS